MRNRATLLFITVWIPLIGFASDSGLIVPGDRLEVKWWGPSYSATELSVVQTNGTVLLGDCTYARLQGKSRPEAVKAICGLLYVSNGKTNIIQGASVRKIAQIPAPLGFSVFQSGNSNVVFRLINTTTNSVRLPSAGYALSDFYIPVNTNPAYAVFHKPETDVGLWLTRNWRYVGNDWMTASHKEWEDRLRIRTLHTGDHLDIMRSTGLWAGSMLTNSNTVVRFNFQISQDWAEEYGLWEGYLCATGLTERTVR